MNGATKQLGLAAVVALVVTAGGSIAGLKTLGVAAGLTTEDKVLAMIETQSKSSGNTTEPVVRQMIADLCPYTLDRGSLVEAVASLQMSVKENTAAMGELKTSVAVLSTQVQLIHR